MIVTETRRGMLEMAAAMFLSGTLGYFVLKSGQDAFNVVFFRCLFGATSLFVYCALCGYLTDTKLTHKTLLLAIIGGVAIVTNWALLFSSYSLASISISTAVYHTQPFFLLLIGALVFHEKIPGNKIVWIGVAFIGVLLTINLNLSEFSTSSSYLFGLALALSAAVFYAIATMITKHLKGIKPHLIALIQVMTGVVLLAPMANFQSLPQSLTDGWDDLLVLGIVHTCLMYILMYSAFQKLPTPLIAVLSFIYPIVAIGVDYIFFGHALNWLQFVGVALIMFGSFAVNQNLRLPGFIGAPKPSL